MRPGPTGADNRNLLIAMLLAAAILFGYDYFVVKPQQAARQREAAARQEQTIAAPQAGAAPAIGAPATPIERDAAIAESARVAFEAPSMDGSISLIGSRFDDVSLRRYRQSVERDSPEVVLFSPRGSVHAADAVLGWEERDVTEPLAGASTLWRQVSVGPLGPDNPLRLEMEADGLRIARTIEIAGDFLFAVTDTVTNTGDRPRAVRPYGVVRRLGLPANYKVNGIVHQGMTGVFGDEPVLQETKFQAAQKHARAKAQGKKQADSRLVELDSQGGWLGLSEHYWLQALIPAQDETITAWYDSRPEGPRDDFRAAYRGSFREIAPGAAATYTQRLFTGAKEAELLQQYQKELGAPQLDRAIDWGNFWFFTRPLYWLLYNFGLWLGNYGLAIMATTVVIKAVFFPLVNQSYKSMSKLRLLQPKMKEVQEKYAADKQRQQQEMIALYQREKINPLAGCLPMLIPIPIFFALYKTITVTIEMRHAPFFGWIRDLSAPDPTTLFNLFGLLPFDPTGWPLIGSLLAIGVWPLLNGLTMWGITSLSPPPTDPVQARIFQLIPILYVFLFAGFAAGLVIYWTWSNLLTIGQQYVIMRRNGVETELDKFLAKRLRKPAPASSP